MKKSLENGYRFIPEVGGHLEELWKEKGYDQLNLHLPELEPKTTPKPPGTIFKPEIFVKSLFTIRTYSICR